MLLKNFKVTCRRKIKILTVVTARREPARRRVCGKTLGSKPRPWQPQPDRVIQFLDGTFKETRDSKSQGREISSMCSH